MTMQTNEHLLSDACRALDALRVAGRNVLGAHDALLEVWRSLSVPDVARCCTGADIELLRQLIKSRIDPLNAFELLAQVDVSSAMQALLGWYLGKGVDPDTKFGGYTFELSTMLDDLYEIAGEDALRQLIHMDAFDRNRLDDPRVREAFCDALDIAPQEFAVWLASSTAVSSE